MVLQKYNLFKFRIVGPRYNVMQYDTILHTKTTYVKILTNGRSWSRHQMETFSALLAICAGNSPVTGKFPTLRPVTRSFDVFFDLRLNKQLSKQS